MADTLMGFGEKLCAAIARATMTGLVVSTETRKLYEGKIRRRVEGAVEDTPGLLARLVTGTP
jgi:hypothetical protein